MKRASTKRRKPSAREVQLRLFVAKDAEIQRLRAAMVHAMDDAESGARETNSLTAKHVLLMVAARLKAALEKK